MPRGNIAPKTTLKKVVIPVGKTRGAGTTSPHVLRLTKEGHHVIADRPDAASFSRQHESKETIEALIAQETNRLRDISVDELIETRTQSPRELPQINFFQKDLQNYYLPEISQEDSIEDAVMCAIGQYESALPSNIRVIKPAFNVRPHVPTAAHPHISIIKTVVMFGAAALVVTLPLHAAHFIADAHFTGNEIRSVGSTALQHLSAAGAALSSGNTPNAHYALSDAAHSFNTINDLISQFQKDSSVLSTAIPGVHSQLESAKALSTVAEKSTEAISKLTDSLHLNQGKLSSATIAPVLAAAVAGLDSAEKTLQTVSITSLPASLQPQVTQFKSTFTELTDTLHTLSKTITTWNTLLAHNPSQTVLLIFQNNNELRATGGFWGSFAMVKVKDGALTEFTVPGGGTYDLQGNLNRRLQPPAPLQLVQSEWQFQDANWFADFPTSAKTAVWFLEHSGYQTPDAVVAFTPTVLQKILSVVGPVELPAYHKTITADNVVDELQNAVENEYDHTENKPKKIIGDLMTSVLDRVSHLKGDALLQAVALLYDSLSQKDILLYHQNGEMQKLLADAGWDGRVAKDWNDDYLMVVDSNIAGQKTDKVMTQDIIKDTTIHENGAITTTLTIRRTHTGHKGDAFTGMRNVNYLRVLVPEGSQLLSANGFSYPDENLFKPADATDVLPALAETTAHSRVDDASGTAITHEHGKTVFGNWTMTDPGQSTVVTLTYQLPFHVKPVKEGNPLIAHFEKPVASYTLLAQSQPGSRNSLFTHSLHIPASWNVVASTNKNGSLVETLPLTQDLLTGIVATEK